jgi:uncharacterized membrane protein
VTRINHFRIFALILVAGIGMRFHALDRQSLWDDEMATRKDVYLPVSVWPAMFHVYEMHPPLYFYQLKGWQAIFGDSLAALRANSALWGSLTLLLFYLLARQVAGANAGLVALALMAFSPYHLAYSQEMRPYAMAIALSVLGFYWLERCVRTAAGLRLRWVLLALIFIAELYTHYWGTFVFLAQCAYGWVATADDRRSRRRLLASGAVAALAFTAWLPTLESQLHYIKDLSFWVPQNSPANLAKTLVSFSGLYFRYAASLFRIPGGLALRWGVGLVYVYLFFRAVKVGSRAAWIWLTVGIGVPYLLAYYRHGLYVWYRYPCVVYPAFLLLITQSLKAVRPPLRGVFLGMMLAAGAAGCWKYKTAWQKANPKQVVAYVQALKGARAAVVRPAYFAPLYAYYDRGTTFVVDEDKLLDPTLRQRLHGENILFLAFDVPEDNVRDQLLREFQVVSARRFPAYGHLGITVYQLH